MNRCKSKIDKSKFEYWAGDTTVLLDIDRIEFVIADQDNKTILIKMYSGDEFRYENKDENEIIEAYFALTNKFRKNKQ